MALKLKHPFNMLVSGPSNCGKTVFMLKFIENLQHLCEPVPQKIIWAFSEWQPSYDKLRALPFVELVEGVPNFDILKEDKNVPKLLILDDLMTELKNDEKLTVLFSRGSHHWGCSVVHMVQSIFYDGLRTSRRNATYIVLFRSPSDTLAVQTLGRQIFTSKAKYFLESYLNATQKAYGYIFLNLHQLADDKYRLLTDIFPGQATIVYVAK